MGGQAKLLMLGKMEIGTNRNSMKWPPVIEAIIIN